MPLGSFSGGGLGMGVAFTLEDNFSNTAKQISSQMGNLENTVDKLTAKMQAVNMKDVGMKMLGMGVAMAAPLGIGLKYAAEFEQAEIALSTLAKSSEKGHAIFEQIKKDAASTPFATEELLQGNIALLSAGENAEKAREVILNLGNAIAGAGKGSAEMSRMVANLQAIKNVGKATSMDIKQFGMAGINIYQLLADSTGKSIKQVQEMDVTYEELAKALAHAKTETGLYYNALENQSKSVFGKWSTLMDGFKFSLAGAGKALFDVAHPMLDFLIKLADKAAAFIETPLGKTIVQITAGVALFLIVGGGLLILLGYLKIAALQASAAFMTMILPILPYLAAFVAVGVAAYFIYKKFADVFEAIGQIWSSFDLGSQTFTLTESLAKSLDAKGMLGGVLTLATWLIRLKTLLIGIRDGFVMAWGHAKILLKALWENVLKPIAKLIYDMFPALAKATSGFSAWFSIGKTLGYALVVVLGLITVALVSMAVAGIVAMAPILFTIGAIVLGAYLLYKAITNIGVAFDWIKEKTLEFVNIGKVMVTSIMSGISSMWGTFTTWLAGKIKSLPLVGGFIGNFMSETGGVENKPAIAPNTDKSKGLGERTAGLKAATRPEPTIIDKSSSNVSSVNLHVALDSRPIAKQVVELNNRNHNRTIGQ